MEDENVIILLDFPYTQITALLEFVNMRKQQTEDRRDQASTIAVRLGSKRELMVIGVAQTYLQDAQDRIMNDSGYNSAPRGFVFPEHLHSWIVDQMQVEADRHDDWKASYTGFECTEAHAWKLLLERFKMARPYGYAEDPTALVMDDPVLDELLAA